MEPIDDRILEYLDEETMATPSAISRSRRRDVSVQRIRERLRVLTQAGYVEPFTAECELYELTRWGDMFLDGEARADQIVPKPSPHRDGYVLD
jgi:DNA-binding Lrp family transcriptional regulator